MTQGLKFLISIPMIPFPGLCLAEPIYCLLLLCYHNTLLYVKAVIAVTRQMDTMV